MCCCECRQLSDLGRKGWIIPDTPCMISRHLSGQAGKQTAMSGFGGGGYTKGLNGNIYCVKG